MAPRVVRMGGLADTDLARGINLAADTVSVTLGPGGRAVLIGQRHANSLLVRDAYAILQHLDLPNCEQQMGVRTMRELAWRMLDQVGGGASTAVVIARALIRVGVTARMVGLVPPALHRAMERHCSAVIGELDNMSVSVTSQQQLLQVARQAAHNDLNLAKSVCCAHSNVGKDGLVIIEEHRGTDDKVSVKAGLTFEAGWISPLFADDPSKRTVELDDPLLLLHLGPLNDVAPIVRVLEMFATAGRALVIIAGDVGGEALSTLIANKQHAGLKVAAVKAPGTGPWRAFIMEDIAVATGGTVIGDAAGFSVAHLRPQMLGRAKRILISRDETSIIGGRGASTSIEWRAQEIRRSILRERNLSYDRDQHRRRLAQLTTGVATIRLGGATSVEISDRVAKAKSAAAAVREAQTGGLLPGSSSALVHAERRARRTLDGDLPGRVIGQMFKAGLQAPLFAAASNAGVDARNVLAQLETGGEGVCFDAAERRFTGTDHLFDPLTITKTAVRSAVSIASRLLETEGAVSLKAAHE
jgi:chaperonin GroEL